MNKILVAFDYFSPKYPLLNNQNFNTTFSELDIDNGTFEFFKHIGGYECVPSLQLNEYDYFVYPIRLGLNPDDWLNRPEADLLATTNMSIHTFNSIRGRNGFLLLDLGNESIITGNNNYDKILDTIHAYLKRKDIPLRKVILQIGNANGKKYYDDYCYRKQLTNGGLNISCLEYFEWLSSRLISEHRNAKLPVLPKNINFSKIEKTFLCLNRVYRPHRVNLFLFWNVYGLIDDTYYTMSDKHNWPSNLTDTNFSWQDMVDPFFVEKLNLTKDDLSKIQKKLPLKLDEQTDASSMALLYGKIDTFYQQSLISIVTETNFESNDIFNTEKIFKPMVHRHPFILVGPYKTLQHLKDMGYKTFSEFWDESYDDIENPNERLLKIVELCKEIKNWDIETKKKFFYKSMHVTNHNYELLLSQYPDNMRKNFWHRLRDYVYFEKNKEKKI